MPKLLLAAALTVASGLAGCSGFDDAKSGVSGGASDIGSSISGGFGRNTDTYGTQRRVDVYGGSTAPSLPTIGASGFGK